MKIAVAVKQVPARDSLLRVRPDGRWIDDADLGFEINEPDAYALEAALQLRERHGGEVVVVCAGPARASQTIREALAKGADRALHIQENDLDLWDSLALSRLMAAAVATEQPDLLLTGLQSDDAGSGQTGIVLAEFLGLPHASLVISVEVEEGRVRVKRELEDGWFQNVTLPLPAALTIQSGISKLRYATLMGIKKAKTKEVKPLSAVLLGVAPEPVSRLARIFAPERHKQTQLLTGSPAEAAAQLVEKLRFEARVL